MPIYFVSHEGGEFGPIKIGRAANIKRRIRDLQTGNPETLRLLGYIHSDDDVALERALHDQFANALKRGEWYYVDVLELLPILKDAGVRGYVPADDAIYEFAGNDRNGFPEFVRGACWLDLEPNECCPSCGCFGGMHYQRAVGQEICQCCGFMDDEDQHKGD